MNVSVGKVLKSSAIGIAVLVAGFIVLGYGNETDPNYTLYHNTLNPAFSDSHESVRFDIHGHIYDVPRVYLWSRGDVNGGKKDGFSGHAYLRIDEEDNAQVEPFSSKTWRSENRTPGRPREILFTVTFDKSLKSNREYIKIYDENIEEIEIYSRLYNSKFADGLIFIGENRLFEYFLSNIKNLPLSVLFCRKKTNEYKILSICKANFVRKKNIVFRISFARRYIGHFETIVRDTTALMDSFAR